MSDNKHKDSVMRNNTTNHAAGTGSKDFAAASCALRTFSRLFVERKRLAVRSVSLRNPLRDDRNQALVYHMRPNKRLMKRLKKNTDKHDKSGKDHRVRGGKKEITVTRRFSALPTSQVRSRGQVGAVCGPRPNG